MTLYIDIYFLLNFTVDLVSLHFAAMLSGIRTTNKRLLISAAVCASASSGVVLSPSLILDALFAVISLLFSVFFVCKEVSLKRRAVFAVSFIIFLSLVGSIISFAWNWLKEVFSEFEIEGDVVNRKMLFFALIILLSIGVFKMMIGLMSTGKIKTRVEFEIKFLGQSCRAEALIDTGNLITDPLSMKPVMIIKRELAKTFLSENLLEISNLTNLEKSIKPKVRLVPISKNAETHLYVGFIPDKVTVYTDDNLQSIDVTVAIDKEGGDFGGFPALMPFSAINNVVN